MGNHEEKPLQSLLEISRIRKLCSDQDRLALKSLDRKLETEHTGSEEAAQHW